MGKSGVMVSTNSTTGVARSIRTLPGHGSAGRVVHQLVCFPPAGAAASFYQSWRGLLAPHIQLLLVQYPGRENRLVDPPAADLAALSSDIAADLRAVASPAPMTLFGHSMGALVAYEVARNLEHQAASAVHRLVVSGQYAPHAVPPLGAGGLDDDAMLSLLSRLGSPNLAALRTHPEMLAFAADLMRADSDLIDSARLTPSQLGAPITVFGGREDPIVPAAELEHWHQYSRSTTDRPSLYQGGHFYLHDDPAVVVTALNDLLPDIGPHYQEAGFSQL